MRRFLFKCIAWITAHHIDHYEAVKGLLANIGATLMKFADPLSFGHAEQSMEQAEDLHELKALAAAFDLRDMAERQGGWEDHHGIALDMLADILINRHDWDPEDVALFIENLTDGVFALSKADDEED